MDLFKFIAQQNYGDNTLFFSMIATPIGEMICMDIDNQICLLDFVSSKNLTKSIEQVLKFNKAYAQEYISVQINQVSIQLDEYFNQSRKYFAIPYQLIGTAFQKKVWSILANIAYGETLSYKSQAAIYGNIKAVRAVANANGKNRLAILIPCHRVIASNGTLGGYGGGVAKKLFLLNLEK